MKYIPIALQTAYNKPGASTCFFIRVECRNGEIYGFSTADASFYFDDGDGPVLYTASEEFRPQNVQVEANLSVDNTNLLGWFSKEIEQKVLAGVFDSAELSIYKVSYFNLAAGFEVVGFGKVGKIDFAINAKSRRKIEFRSLTNQLKQIVIDQYSLTCRAEFGDERCGMPFVWNDGIVTAVGANPFLNFTVSGVTKPDDYFLLGVIRFNSGDNAQAELEVEGYVNRTDDPSKAVISLSYLTPFPVKPGDTFSIRQDCGKTALDCIAYGNIANMRAEHLTPTQDQSIMVPGAYIKSVGSA